MFVRELLHDLLDLIAPRCCPGCDVWLDKRVPFCPACWPLLERISVDSSHLKSATAAFVYGGPLADGICKLKYQGRTDLTSSLGSLWVHALAPYRDQIDMVVPVPLYPKRLRLRGFNQSALLAAYVANHLKVPLSTNSVWRVRDTLPQVDLDASKRITNVQGAFKAKLSSSGQRVLVIDDVKTTGATMAEAARALCNVGAERVYCLALAQSELD